MSQSDQPSSEQPIAGVPVSGVVSPVPVIEPGLPPRALSSKAAAATKPAVKVTTPVRAMRAFPSRAPVMLDVNSVAPPAPASPGGTAPQPVEVVSASVPEEAEAPPEPEPDAAPLVTQTQKTLGIGLDPTQVLEEVLAQRQQDLLRRLQKMGIQRGQLLFDARWMSANDATSVFRGMRWRSWRTVVEAILLIGAMAASAGVIGILLAVLVGLKTG